MLPGPACGSHHFEELHLAWENSVPAATGPPARTGPAVAMSA